MNINPILLNRKSKWLYVGIWALITGTQMIVLYLSEALSWEYVIADPLVFNMLFALLLLPVWYPVRFNGWERKTWQFNITAHFVLFFIYISLSLSLGYFIFWLFASNNAEYIHFLQFSHWWKILQGIAFYLITVLIYYLYIYIERLNEKATNEIRLTQLVKDSELNLLKSQINPHFLFNSLNSINASIVKNPDQAQKMLVALSDYLRYAVLANNAIYSSLKEEMENIERYLSIEKLRFGDKLVYESTIEEDCWPLKIPAMLLQPLFENAIKHGVYESLGAVRIDARAVREKDHVLIIVSNDYDGKNVSQKKGSGTGLKNIQERLRLSYDSAASLQTKTGNGKYIAMLRIPTE